MRARPSYQRTAVASAISFTYVFSGLHRTDKGTRHKTAADDPSVPARPQPDRDAKRARTAAPQPPPGADAALPGAVLPDAALPDAAPAARPGAAPSGAAPSDATPLDAAPDPPAADPSATISARAGVFGACTEDWAKSYELVDGGFLACRRCKRAADRAGSSHVAVRITLSHGNWKNYAMDHCEKCTALGLDAPLGQRQRRMGEFAGTRPRQN
jgi:hypothetical protein